MITLIQVLLIVLPALLVVAVAYFLLNHFVKLQNKRDEQFNQLFFNSLENMQKVEELRGSVFLKSGDSKLLTPIKLQAFERILLFLERMRLDSIVLRVMKPGMTNISLQSELVHASREEFEHNLSQQLYLSDRTWQAVSSAREEMVSLVNFAASQLKAEATAQDLAQHLIQLQSDGKQKMRDFAITALKEEMRHIY